MCLSGLIFCLQQQEKCVKDGEREKGCFVGAIYQAAKFLAQMSRGKMWPERTCLRLPCRINESRMF